MKKNRLFFLTSCLLGWLTLLPFSIHATEPSELPDAAADAASVIESFHGELLGSMQQASYTARHLITKQAVAQYFRPSTIARISLGRHWRSISSEEQAGLTELIGTLISATYASRFQGFNGQTFSTQGVEALGKDRVRVKTILTAGQETIPLDYQLQHQEDGWRIYDIVAAGVSDLSLKRSNYSALFSEGGLRAVEADIKASIEASEI